MHTKTVFLLLFCWQMVSCKTQKTTCKQLTNLTSYQLTEDAICSKLIELEKDGFALSIYIGDSIPSLVERDNLLHSYGSNAERKAVLFVDFRKQESETMYSDALKEKSYLRARYFMLSINKLLKNEDRSTSILNAIEFFRKVFIEN